MGDPGPLSAKDKELIDAAGVAYSRASELLKWWKSRRDAKALKLFHLPMPRDGNVKLECFYDTLEFGGNQTTAMACSWKSRFPRKTAAAGATPQLAMEAFLNSEFMRRARWDNPDGLPGGFEFIPRQYKF